MLAFFIFALPVVMFGWGVSIFAFRLRRQRRVARLRSAQHIDLTVDTAETAQATGR